MQTPAPHALRLLGCAVVLLVAGCRSSDAGRAASPAAPPASSLVLPGLDGRQISVLNQPGVRGFVFLFVRTDCPISNRYAPEMQRLYTKFSGRGIGFYLVYPESDDTAAMIRAHRQEYRLTIPTVLDYRHVLVRKAGVQVTPEAAVFLPSGQEIYLGRIDDRVVDFGQEHRSAARHDLEDTVTALLAGSTLTPTTNRAVGCYISDTR